MTVPANNTDHIEAKRHRLPHVDIFELNGDELDRIEETATNVGTDLQFATFWIPLGISTSVTLMTTSITSERVYIAFVCATIMSFGFGAYFGAKWWRTRNQFKALISRIRDRQVGPLGQEGSELKLSELDQLPTSQAGPLQMPISTENEAGLLP